MLFSAGYGQSDKLLLKNGSLLYGSIETLNSDEVRLTVENEMLRFPYSSIRMVRLRKNKSQNIDHNLYKELRQYSTKGIQVSLQVGLLHGRENSEQSAEETISFTAQGLYHFSQLLQMGISLGYDHHNTFAVLPILVVYRADFSSRWSTPFFYTGVGYGIGRKLDNDDGNPSLEQVNGGINYQLGLGYRWRFQKIGFEFALGWKHQKVDLDYKTLNSFWTESENNITLNRSINRAELKFGIIF